MIKVVEPEIAAKCRVYYLTDTRIPCVTLKDKRMGLFRAHSIASLDMPLFKAWPKVTWVTVDRMVMKVQREEAVISEKLLERLGMELVLSNGCLTPVLSAYLGYFWHAENNWGKAPV